MTIIRRPTPLGEMISLRNTMDRLFDGTLGRPHSGSVTAASIVPMAEAAKLAAEQGS